MTDDRTYPCNATSNGRRCDYRGTAADLAEHAVEYGHPLCRICQHSLRNHESRTCDRCVQNCRDSLRAIAETFPQAPEVIEHTGDFNLLTMVVDGNADSLRPYKPQQHQRPSVAYPDLAGAEIVHPAFTTLPAGDGREHFKDHWPSDPAVVIAVLDVNERDWRNTFGHGPAVEAASVETCARYLLTWLSLAARTHPTFEEFAAEINQLAVSLIHRTGLADDPVIAGGYKDPIRCFDCKTGRLVRMYRPPVQPVPRPRRGLEVEGLPDEFDCDHCGSIYSTTTYYLAVRAALEAQAAAQAVAS